MKQNKSNELEDKTEDSKEKEIEELEKLMKQFGGVGRTVYITESSVYSASYPKILLGSYTSYLRLHKLYSKYHKKHAKQNNSEKDKPEDYVDRVAYKSFLEAQRANKF